jgi:hypothetical protein
MSIAQSSPERERAAKSSTVAIGEISSLRLGPMIERRAVGAVKYSPILVR